MDTRTREAYSIKSSVEKFKDLIKGHHVIVYTDHQSLIAEKILLNLKYRDGFGICHNTISHLCT